MSVVLTIMHKEFLEIWGSAFKDKSTRLNMAFLPLFILLVSFQALWSGPGIWAWSTLAVLPATAAILTPFLAAESFTGERERHTLDTLLASPAPEEAILLGKALAHFLIVLATAATAILLQLVFVAIIRPDVLAQAPLALVLGAMLLLLIHLFLFFETAGIFIGQRAATTTAGNTMVFPFLLFPPAAVALYLLIADAGAILSDPDLPRKARSLVNLTIAACYGGIALLFPFIWTRNRAHRLMEGTT